MRNEFFRIVLNSKNEFRAEANFIINGIQFVNTSVKIDTGCPRTSFPFLRMGISDADAYRLKQADSGDDAIKKTISFGVNDSRAKKEEDRKKFHDHRYMELNSISFRHIAKDLSIGGVLLGDYEVSVNYDRIGNILIGMDILRTLVVYIGKSEGGEIVLLACIQNNITQGFKDEINNLLDPKKLI